jgi:hypothetical protein
VISGAFNNKSVHFVGVIRVEVLTEILLTVEVVRVVMTSTGN